MQCVLAGDMLGGRCSEGMSPRTSSHFPGSSRLVARNVELLFSSRIPTQRPRLYRRVECFVSISALLLGSYQVVRELRSCMPLKCHSNHSNCKLDGSGNKNASAQRVRLTARCKRTAIEHPLLRQVVNYAWRRRLGSRPKQVGSLGRCRVMPR